MAIETKEKQIGSSSFKINTMANGKRMKYMTRLTKVFGGSLTAMFGGGESAPVDVDTLAAMKAKELAEVSVDAPALTPEQEVLLAKKAEKDQEMFAANITKAVNLLVEGLDKEDVGVLVKELYNDSQVQKEGKLADYDNGIEFGELLQVLYWIVQENFGSVFQLGGIRV